jgi:ABC-type molybdate transport system substrate-binding protein
MRNHTAAAESATTPMRMASAGANEWSFPYPSGSPSLTGASSPSRGGTVSFFALTVGADYGMIVLEDAPEGARALADFSLEPQAQQILRNYGFGLGDYIEK